MGNNVLSVKKLKTTFSVDTDTITAVDGVSFHIDEGEILGLIGESGCGKSVTSLSILKLLNYRFAQSSADEVLFTFADGTAVDIDKLAPEDEQMHAIRGKEIAMIFQEPMSALTPIKTVGSQIAEMILAHEEVSDEEVRERSIKLLEEVGINDAEKRIDSYPFELSGGMRQRIVIAIALACNPRLLICDEPTTALDVTIEAQILDLLKDLQKKRNMAIILITHDLGVVAEVADRVVVMYTGNVMESSDVFKLYEKPLHPYTQGLLKSIPYHSIMANEPLYTIKGSVPSLHSLPKGCHFAGRCDQVMSKCTEAMPLLKEEDGREVRCYLYG